MSKSLLPCKPHLTYQQQLQLLLDRGLLIHNQEFAIKKLSHIGYYRLSGYWFPAKKEIDGRKVDQFEINTSFESICDFYLFDTKLRNLILYGIERIEIYLKAIIAYEIGSLNPKAHLMPEFINIAKHKEDYEKWTKKLDKKIEDSKDKFIQWNKKNYEQVPIWVSVEVWDFGMLSKFYEVLNRNCKKIISEKLKIERTKDLKTILHCLNIVRNKCAHHSRLWDCKLNSYFPIGSIKTINLSDIENYIQIQKKINHTKLASIICAIWGITKLMTTNKSWLIEIVEHIKSKPNIANTSVINMGFDEKLTLDYLLTL